MSDRREFLKSAGFLGFASWSKKLPAQPGNPGVQKDDKEESTGNISSRILSLDFHDEHVRRNTHKISWALMNDGYYAGETAAYHIGPSYGTKVWFDEYDTGGIGQGYLGQPTRDWRGAIQTRARWNYGPLGVWAREFEGGIAIMNPKGNGPVTLTIQDLGGQRWKHFLGTEDADTNNGQNVTDSVTLADRDGVILLRRHPLGENPIPTPSE